MSTKVTGIPVVEHENVPVDTVYLVRTEDLLVPGFWKDWEAVKAQMPPVRRVFFNEVLGEFQPTDPRDWCVRCRHHVDAHTYGNDHQVRGCKYCEACTWFVWRDA